MPQEPKFKIGDEVIVDGEEYVVSSIKTDGTWFHVSHHLYVLEDDEGFISEYEPNIQLKS